MQPRRLLAGSTPRCTLGCPLLDKLLRGGITCGSVTELVGEPAALDDIAGIALGQLD